MTESDTSRTFDVLITAGQAFSRLEQEFLSAKQEIRAGFRIFDPWTKLRSDAARQHGTDWFDLLVHTLNRGVKISMILTDFDPVVRMNMHLYAWQCLRAFVAAGEASNHPENLSVRVAMHPARVGLLPRIVLWPRSVKEIGDQITRITDDQNITTEELLENAPRVRDLTKRVGGTLRPRRFPPPPLVPVTHHQKLAVFDKARLYIGGLDLNDRRYDTPKHQQPGEGTWHDVQVLVSGPIAQEADTHLQRMEDEFSGRDTHQPKKLLRTISAKRRIALPYLSPREMVQEIAQAHRDAINATEEMFYFESQFFRNEALARHLAERARTVPSLTMVMMLPAAPEEIAFQDSWGPDTKFGEHLQAKCIDIAQDAFGERMFIGAPAQPRRHDTDGRDTHFGAPIIYLHAKVSLFDDHTGIISSANLNGRSLRWDTEAGVKTETLEEVAQIKQKCFAHWLVDDAGSEFFDNHTACQAWAQRAASNARAKPEDRKGFVLPYLAEAGRKDAQPLPGVPAEMA